MKRRKVTNGMREKSMRFTKRVEEEEEEEEDKWDERKEYEIDEKGRGGGRERRGQIG
jgi:hypothetical protein